MKNKLSDINSNFSEWYQEVVYEAELADQAPVRGCIVIRPYGYSLWENIRSKLDEKIKATGHTNAAFPLLIPLSFLQKEAKHVEGFAPEVAVVTHAGGKELEEPLVVRPTSETIIHYMYAKWLKSWRDLPIKINQWANVVRWEMRTRPFLRTTEFHWQEGHTAHETYQEALDEVYLMLKQYKDLIEQDLAIPVIDAKKPESERFAGADITTTVEGLMPDGRALQMGTSHMISQDFAKSFNMMFQDREGKMAYPYLTSWGATTRLIGAVVMVHGDQKGLILPPRIAPIQIVIIPIIKAGSQEKVLSKSKEINAKLEKSFRTKLDDSENNTPGAKFFEWELKGVPLRLEIGPRDLESNQAVLVNRLTGEKKTISLDLEKIDKIISLELDNLQKQLFERALAKRKELWFKSAKIVEFEKDLENKGGLYQTGWCGRLECEEQVKTRKATIRCVLKESDKEFNKCFHCDQESSADIIVAKAY